MIRFIGSILIIFQFSSCGPILQSYETIDWMNKKQLDFPTLSHENEIKVYYKDLNILPEDSFYLVLELSTEWDVPKQRKIERLKQMAQSNGLDAIIVTGSTPIHKSFERSNITLLDVLTGSDPEPPTVEHYTVERLYAQGIKFKERTNLTGLVKEYKLYDRYGGGRDLLASFKPVNNKLPITDHSIIREIRRFSFPFLVEEKTPYWSHNATEDYGDYEIRKYRNQTYKLYKDSAGRITRIKCVGQYKMDIVYNTANKPVEKVIDNHVFKYHETLVYDDNGRLIQKVIKRSDYKNKKDRRLELDISYFDDNSSLVDYSSILYKINR